MEASAYLAARRHVVEIFERHNPGRCVATCPAPEPRYHVNARAQRRLGDVDALLAQWAGREERLVADLRRTYEGPADFSRASELAPTDAADTAGAAWGPRRLPRLDPGQMAAADGGRGKRQGRKMSLRATGKVAGSPRPSSGGGGGGRKPVDGGGTVAWGGAAGPSRMEPPLVMGRVVGGGGAQQSELEGLTGRGTPRKGGVSGPGARYAVPSDGDEGGTGTPPVVIGTAVPFVSERMGLATEELGDGVVSTPRQGRRLNPLATGFGEIDESRLRAFKLQICGVRCSPGRLLVLAAAGCAMLSTVLLIALIAGGGEGDSEPGGLGQISFSGEGAQQVSQTLDCVGDWSGWGACSLPCGGGLQTQRYRVRRRAFNGGEACAHAEGEMRQRECNTALCGAFAACEGGWSEWSPCTASCQRREGAQHRAFSVRQRAQSGGHACASLDGDAEERHCTADCPVDCAGAWGAWGACSALCGGGLQRREYAVWRAPKFGGQACVVTDGARQFRACNQAACGAGANCVGSWGAWGSCSASCGAGARARVFSVEQEARAGARCLCVLLAPLCAACTLMTTNVTKCVRSGRRYVLRGRWLPGPASVPSDQLLRSELCRKLVTLQCVLRPMRWRGTDAPLRSAHSGRWRRLGVRGSARARGRPELQ